MALQLQNIDFGGFKKLIWKKRYVDKNQNDCQVTLNKKKQKTFDVHLS